MRAWSIRDGEACGMRWSDENCIDGTGEGGMAWAWAWAWHLANELRGSLYISPLIIEGMERVIQRLCVSVFEKSAGDMGGGCD